MGIIVRLTLLCLMLYDVRSFLHPPQEVSCGSELDTYCKCQMLPELIVSCYNIPEVMVFLSEIAGQRTIYLLDLSDNDIRILHAQAFGDLIIEHMDLSSNHLGLYGDPYLRNTFSQQEKLELLSLDLSDNLLTYIPRVLQDLLSLKSLDLRGNSLNALSANAILIPDSLERMFLPSVEKLPFGFWSEENNLMLLEMTPEFSDKSLGGMLNINPSNFQSLEVLILNSGDYEFDSQDVISKLSGLRHLEIRHCGLSDEQVDKTLDHNEGRSILSLTLVNISLNFIPEKLLNNLHSLTSLDLSHNSIKMITIQSFIGNSELEFLNLSHNKISLMQSGIFHNLLNLVELDLSNNALTSIGEDIFPEHLMHGMILMAAANPLICDCDNWWFMKLVTEQYEGSPGPLDQYEIHNSLTCSQAMTNTQMMVYEAYIFLTQEAHVSC